MKHRYWLHPSPSPPNGQPHPHPLSRPCLMEDSRGGGEPTGRWRRRSSHSPCLTILVLGKESNSILLMDFSTEPILPEIFSLMRPFHITSLKFIVYPAIEQTYLKLHLIAFWWWCWPIESAWKDHYAKSNRWNRRDGWERNTVVSDVVRVV